MNRQVVAAGLLVSWAVSCSFSQEPLRRLGSDRFADREAAMRGLWSSPAEMRDVLEAAERDGDAELAARARWILRRWEMGLRPTTPPDRRRAVQNAATTDDVEELLELLRDGVVDPFLQRLREQDPLAMQSVGRLMAIDLPRVTYHLLQADRADAVEELLDRCAQRPLHAMLLMEFRQKLGRDEAVCRQLPSAAAQWQPEDRHAAAALIEARLGDRALAVEQARQNNRWDIAATLLIDQGDWNALAELAHAKLQTLAASSSDQPRWAVMTLLAARCSDRADLHEDALKVLQAITPASPAAGMASLGWLLEGDSRRALKVLSEDDRDDLLRCLYVRHEYALAAETLGLNPQSLEADLATLTETTRQRSYHRSSPQFTESFEHALEAARVAYYVGARAAARDTFRQLSRLLTNGNDSTLDEVLRQLPSTSKQWGIEFIAAPVANGRLESLTYLTSYWSATNLTWHALEEVLPDTSITHRLELLQQLAKNELPHGWQVRGLPDQLAAAALRVLDGMPDENDEGQNGRREREPQEGEALAMSEWFGKIGRADLAELFRWLDYDQDSTFTLAKQELMRGNPAVALDLFRSFVDQEDDTLFLKSLVGQELALRALGRVEDAVAQQRILDHLPLTGQQRAEIASLYDEFGWRQHGRQQIKQAWQTAWADSGEAYSIALGAASEADKLTAADERALWCMRAGSMLFLRQEAIRGNWLINPLQWFAVNGSASAALAAVGREDLTAAKHWTRISLRLNPSEVDLVEHVAPAFRKAGDTEFSDMIIGTVEAHYDQHLQSFPADPTVNNNLAWVLALSDRSLEKALALSQKAVYYDPDSTAYRDTLAETLYRMGRQEEALRVERACLLETPDDWHLHQQIERFQKPYPTDLR